MIILRVGQNERELSLRKYFEIVTKPTTTGPIGMITGGSFLVIISLLMLFNKTDSSTDGSSAFGVLLLLIGVVIGATGGVQLASIESRYAEALRAAQPQPSDVEVDSWFQESYQGLILHSKNILNLVGTERDFSEPLVIVVPTLASTYGVPTEDIKWQKGKDTKLRFAVHKFVIIYLTERHLAAYTCDFNFIRNVPLNETTREYHYPDIISVATYEWSQAFTLPTGQKLSTAQIFRLAVASGESLEVRLETEQLRNMTKEEAVPTIAADQTVRTIRAMLREKKA